MMNAVVGRIRRAAQSAVCMLVAAGAPTGARAQDADSSPCAGQDFAILDFWIGTWTVHSGEQQVGTNRIGKILGGCAITEDWVGAGGGRGHSLFYYVPAEGRWMQVWVTEDATTSGGVKEKRLIERLPDGGVRFRGEIALEGGGSYLDRTTLTPLDRGRVRQHIEISTDGGATWRTTFDAEYRPAVEMLDLHK